MKDEDINEVKYDVEEFKKNDRIRSNTSVLNSDKIK